MSSGITFTYEVDQAEMAAIMIKLNELSGGKARTYIARALNKTAVTARVKLGRKAQQSYTVKKRGFNGSMKIKRATAGNLIAEINSDGFPLSMKEFSHSFSRPSPARADIVYSGLKPVMKYGNKAFVGKGELNGHIYVRTGKPAKMQNRLNREQYRAKKGRNIAKSREGLEKLFSKSVPYMLGSDNRVYGPLQPQIRSDLAKYISQQIAMLLG